MPFGLRDGKLLHISEVSSGLDCGCVCAGCNAQLVARKGKIKQHHFAHAADSDCATGYETALHLAAKDIIERRKEIMLPPVKIFKTSSWPHGLSYRLDKYTDEFTSSEAMILANEHKYQVDNVLLESRLGRIIPDVVVHISAIPLIIEIKVTHAVDKAKLRHIKKLKTSAIEIDLSKIPRDINIPSLESLIIDASEHKKWLYNRVAVRKAAELQKEAWSEFKQKKRRRQEHERVQAERQQRADALKDLADTQARHLPVIRDAKGQQFITAGCPMSLSLYRFYYVPFKACAVRVKDIETVLPDFAAAAEETVMSGCKTRLDCEPCDYYHGLDNGFIRCAGMSDYAIATLRAGIWTNYDGTGEYVSRMSLSQIARVLRYLSRRGQSAGNSAWVKALTEELESRQQQDSLQDNQSMLQSA